MSTPVSQSVAVTLGGESHCLSVMEATVPKRIKKSQVDPFNLEVGLRLAHLRRAVGYGDREQTAFARQVGLRANHLNMIESGKRGLRPQQALDIRRQFGVTLDWLYSGDGQGIPDELRRRLTALITKK